MILLTFHVCASLLWCHRIRNQPIRIVRVVVVQVAIRVDIPEIRAVRHIRRTEPPIVRAVRIRKDPIY